MNKTFTPLLLAAIAFGMNAQAEPLHYLDLVETTSGFDRYIYRYTNFNKVSEIQHIDYDNMESSTFRQFTYNDKEQLIEESIAQDYYETEFLDQYIPVSRVEYEWNDKGQMVKRSSWNKTTITGDFEETAILTFIYDEDGKLGKVETSFAATGNTVQRDDYFYDADGRLMKREVWNMLYGNTYLGNTIQYTYNAVGDISNITGYDYDAATGSLRPNSITDYIYNSSGDLEKIQEWSDTRGMLLSEKIYTYTTDFSLEDTIFPRNFEDEYWTADGSEFNLVKHPITSRSEYFINDTTGTLEFTDKYEYTYTTELKPGQVGIEAITMPGASVAFKSLRNGLLQLDGISDFDNVSIVDMEGRPMMNRTYNCGINVSELAPGAYFAITTGGVVKFVK